MEVMKGGLICQWWLKWSIATTTFLRPSFLSVIPTHTAGKRSTGGGRERVWRRGKKLCLVTSSQPLVLCAPWSKFMYSARLPLSRITKKEATCWFISDHPSDWAWTRTDAGVREAAGGDGLIARMDGLMGRGEEGALGNRRPACLVMVLVISGDLGCCLAGWISAVPH